MEYLADEVSSDEEDYENLKSTLETVMGKERFKREISHARSVRYNISLIFIRKGTLSKLVLYVIYEGFKIHRFHNHKLWPYDKNM
jgi:hypothetical protein